MPLSSIGILLARPYLRRACALIVVAALWASTGLSKLQTSSTKTLSEVKKGPTDPREFEQFLDSFFKDQMEKLRIPGASFVFVKDGAVFFKKGYGFADLERRQPVSPDTTIFRIGSISKAFTADAVVQLADRRQLDLEADVNKYLKHLKVPDTFAEPVTAATLISHTAGFDEIRPGTQSPDKDHVLSLADFLRPRLVRLWRPGQIPMYSTYGITVAGLVIEDVSGLPFEEYLKRNVWSPLGMSRTSITVPDSLRSDVAIGYEYKKETDTYEPQKWEWYHTTPASSMNSTASDMAKWIIAHLQNGKYGEVRLMSEKAARETLRSHATGHPKIHGFTYGFHEEAYGTLRLVEHGGNMAGFSSLVVLIPERNAGFFVVAHGEDSQLRDNLRWALMDRYYSPEQKLPVPTPSANFNVRAHLFVGRYGYITYCHTCPGHQPGMIFRVTSNSDGSLTINGRRWIETEPLLFVREDGLGKIAFRADQYGRITHMFFGGFWVFEKWVP